MFVSHQGEEEFEKDELLEGGRRAVMTNGTEYKEVRQYTSDHHQVRFYFLTRIYSDYVERILEDFEKGQKPDLVIINSCVWDVSRYSFAFSFLTLSFFSSQGWNFFLDVNIY